MKIYQHHNLKPYNTFGIEVFADEFIVLETKEDIVEIVRSRDDRLVVPTLILGGGSNVLFTKDFHGTVLKIDTRGIRILEENENDLLIKAAAGEDWDGLVSYCVKNGWGGLENLSGIPGNVGSSPIQNIGAYGSELKDVFHSLEALEIPGGNQLTLSREQCRFGYRDSIFKREWKGRIIITDVILRLSRKARPNLAYQVLAQKFIGVSEDDISIGKIRDAVLQIRNSKLPDPKIIGNAGSFFKNPLVTERELMKLKEKYPGIVYFLNPPPSPLPNIREGVGGRVKSPTNRETENGNFKLAAGWLIEQCGWKGYRDGDAGVHIDQALVLVNYGNATGRQIFELSEKIRKSVVDKFGVDLEREVNIF